MHTDTYDHAVYAFSEDHRLSTEFVATMRDDVGTVCTVADALWYLEESTMCYDNGAEAVVHVVEMVNHLSPSFSGFALPLAQAVCERFGSVYGIPTTLHSDDGPTEWGQY